MGDNKRSGQEKGRKSNITETKERDLDWPAVGEYRCQSNVIG